MDEKLEKYRFDYYKKLTTLEELFDFMNKNIKYGYADRSGVIHKSVSGYKITKLDSSGKEVITYKNEYVPQTIEKTLKYGYGMCMDQVILEKDFCERNNIPYHSISLDFKSKDGKYNIERGHIFLVAIYDNKYVYFENAYAKERYV